MANDELRALLVKWTVIRFEVFYVVCLSAPNIFVYRFQWARDAFEGLFTIPAENVNQYIGFVSSYFMSFLASKAQLKLQERHL